MSDHRVFFAAERTLLAWLRTGLTVMALGFVVAKFGLFLRLLSSGNNMASSSPQDHWISNILGILLIIVGAFIILAAQYNHRIYIKLLPTEDIPPIALNWLSSFLSLSLAVVGILLMIYLISAI
jgi:putative membrane protein